MLKNVVQLSALGFLLHPPVKVQSEFKVLDKYKLYIKGKTITNQFTIHTVIVDAQMFNKHKKFLKEGQLLFISGGVLNTEAHTDMYGNWHYTTPINAELLQVIF